MSRGTTGPTTNLVTETPNIGNLPAGGTNLAPGRSVPSPVPEISTAPGLLPESIDYIVSVVLRQTLDSQLAQVLEHEQISSYLDITDLTESDIGRLQYTKPILDDNGNETGEETLRPISRHACKLINLFNAYCRYRFAILDDPVTVENCIKISPVDFINFRQSQHTLQFLGSSVVTQPSSSSTKRTLAQEFSRTVKIDTSSYPILREDKNWDTFDRSLHAVCRAHGPLNVLTKTYYPTLGTPEFDLFDKHQGFLFQIFDENLKTDKGKELVCKYQTTYDAQRIYCELAQHCTQSIIADQTAANKMTWLTGTKLEEGSWRGTTESFITYWQEQLRLYHELVPYSSRMPDEVVRGLLEMRYLKCRIKLALKIYVKR